MQFFLILTLVFFRGDIRKKKGIFIQVPTVLMAGFGLFGSRFLISSPVPPPPPPENVHIMVLIAELHPRAKRARVDGAP